MDAVQKLLQKKGCEHFYGAKTDDLVMAKVARWILNNEGKESLPRRMKPLRTLVASWSSRTVLDIDAICNSLVVLEDEGIISLNRSDGTITYPRKEQEKERLKMEKENSLKEAEALDGPVNLEAPAISSAGYVQSSRILSLAALNSLSDGEQKIERVRQWIMHPHSSPKSLASLISGVADITQEKQVANVDELLQTMLRDGLITRAHPESVANNSKSSAGSLRASSEDEDNFKISYGYEKWRDALDPLQAKIPFTLDVIHYDFVLQCNRLKAAVKNMKFPAKKEKSSADGFGLDWADSDNWGGSKEQGTWGEIMEATKIGNEREEPKGKSAGERKSQKGKQKQSSVKASAHVDVPVVKVRLRGRSHKSCMGTQLGRIGTEYEEPPPGGVLGRGGGRGGGRGRGRGRATGTRRATLGSRNKMNVYTYKLV